MPRKSRPTSRNKKLGKRRKSKSSAKSSQSPPKKLGRKYSLKDVYFAQQAPKEEPPETPFINFFREYKKKHQNLSIVKIAANVTKLWQNMTTSQKKRYMVRGNKNGMKRKLCRKFSVASSPSPSCCHMTSLQSVAVSDGASTSATSVTTTCSEN